MTTTSRPIYPVPLGATWEAERAITLAADETLAQFTGPPGIPGSAPLGKGDGKHTGFSLRFVKPTGPDLCGLATDGKRVVGLMANKPQVAGDAATVVIRGRAIARAGGALAAGDLVTCNNKGKAVKAVAGDRVLGTALTDAAGEDLQVSVLLQMGAPVL